MLRLSSQVWKFRDRLRLSRNDVEKQADQGETKFRVVKNASGWSVSIKPQTSHSFGNTPEFSYNFLEEEPQSELEIPHLRPRGQVENSAGFCGVTVNAVPGLPQVDVVEDIVALRPEL